MKEHHVYLILQSLLAFASQSVLMFPTTKCDALLPVINLRLHVHLPLDCWQSLWQKFFTVVTDVVYVTQYWKKLLLFLWKCFLKILLLIIHTGSLAHLHLRRSLLLWCFFTALWGFFMWSPCCTTPTSLPKNAADLFAHNYFLLLPATGLAVKRLHWATEFLCVCLLQGRRYSFPTVFVFLPLKQRYSVVKKLGQVQRGFI